MKVYETVHEAYLGTLADILDFPDSTSAPRGQPVRERFDYQFKITKPKMEYLVTKDLERNKVIADYSQKEFDLYNSGSNRVEDFEKISKFWKNLANEDGTVNSAYGYLIWYLVSHGVFTPWAWCLQALKADKDTRQAILRFSLPQHFYVGNKDFTCTLHGFFSIREDKLNLTINMRSNDMMLGLVYDLPWFVSLIYRMVDELKSAYPELTVGSYTHTVHNIHIYDRNLDAINKMLGR